MLRMTDISKVYRTELIETHALRDLTLHVDEGEFVAVTGPSGSGKTTFLNIAGLLETPSNGSYLLDGADVGTLQDHQRSRIRNEKVGFIFQSFNLIPDLSLADNVDVPLRYRGWSGVQRRKAIGEMLDLVGLGSRKDYLPSQLSGGQQQRVAIARALAMNPKVMLFDEPTSALDPASEQRICDTLRDLGKDYTILAISHQTALADVADQTYKLEHGQPRKVDRKPD